MCIYFSSSRQNVCVVNTFFHRKTRGKFKAQTVRKIHFLRHHTVTFFFFFFFFFFSLSWTINNRIGILSFFYSSHLLHKPPSLSFPAPSTGKSLTPQIRSFHSTSSIALASYDRKQIDRESEGEKDAERKRLTMVYCNLRLIWALLPWDLAGSYSSGLVLYETPTLLKPLPFNLCSLCLFLTSLYPRVFFKLLFWHLIC
ncbi:hypothetical protein EDD21DRAFT_180032 [Dissophora ornata]|nr:hypothetical protein EDD21DRAFT_180032 [Dissophora ornata]